MLWRSENDLPLHTSTLKLDLCYMKSSVKSLLVTPNLWVLGWHNFREIKYLLHRDSVQKAFLSFLSFFLFLFFACSPSLLFVVKKCHAIKVKAFLFPTDHFHVSTLLGIWRNVYNFKVFTKHNYFTTCLDLGRTLCALKTFKSPSWSLTDQISVFTVFRML